MKVPTLFGLALLIIGLMAGIFFFNKQSWQLTPIKPVNPQEIQVADISTDQASIVWTTDQASIGDISYGSENKTLPQHQADIRDNSKAQDRLIHFVTLTHLQPDTTYYFQVQNNSLAYPDKPLSFKTAPAKDSPISTTPPLIGVVLDTDLKPVDEAVVILQIPDASNLAVITTTAGNFILPLVNLRDKTLNTMVPPSGTVGTLTIYRGTVKSEVKVKVPSVDPLPEIVLGQDSDLTVNLATDSASLNSGATASPTPVINYDLNSDGKINSFDQAIVSDNLGKTSQDKTFNKKADLNGDGVINQQDMSLINLKIK